MKTLPIPTDIGNYIAIDDSLPSGLIWIKEPSTRGPRLVGKAAGTFNKIGYYQITFKGKRYFCHRVIHFLLTGEDPGDKHIDHHKDQSNIVTNLRPATPSQNQMNKVSRPNSSSKYKGVNWNKRDQKWVAQIGLNGKNKNLGYYHEELDAAYVYNIAASILHGEYARLNELPPDYDTHLFQHKDKIIRKVNDFLSTI